MPSKLDPLFSSEHDDWQTPADLFAELDATYGPFTLDPATTLDAPSSSVILARGGTIHTLHGTWIGPKIIAKMVYLPDRNDGLAERWRGRVFLNPPYGRACWNWIRKAFHEVREGHAECVCALVAARTDVRWWQLYVCSSVVARYEGEGARRVHVSNRHRWPGADVIEFIKGRIRFVGATASAPFPSAIVVWDSRGNPIGGFRNAV